MTDAGWYVAQVQMGREQCTCNAMRNVCKDTMTDNGVPLLEECFSPTHVHRLKYEGKWCDAEEFLLSGYVVVTTNLCTGIPSHGYA